MPSNTDNPTVQIAGQDNAPLTANLLSLAATQDVHGTNQCEATFTNWTGRQPTPGFAFFDPAVLNFGKHFQLKMGSSIVFDGSVTGIEANYPDGQPPRIKVYAEAGWTNLRVPPRTRTFERVSFEDVIRYIALDHQLVVDSNLSSNVRYEALAQFHQSDFAFLLDLARTVDIDIRISGNTLIARNPGGAADAGLSLVYGDSLREFSVCADMTTQRSSVLAGGWGVASKSAFQVPAGPETIYPELQGDASGARASASVFGNRVEVSGSLATNLTEARLQAETQFKQIARRFVTATGTARGDNRIQAGSRVLLQNLGPVFSGKYYVTQVVQQFDATRGWTTALTAERPGIGALFNPDPDPRPTPPKPVPTPGPKPVPLPPTH